MYSQMTSTPESTTINVKKAAVFASSLSHVEQDAELVVLAFLRHFLGADGAGGSTPVVLRPSQLLTVAQTFYTLRTVYSSIRRETDDSQDFSTSAMVCTERDLYYRNPALFGHQRLVHGSIERLCRWLDAAALASALQRRHVTFNDCKLAQMFLKPQCVLTQLRRCSDDAAAADPQMPAVAHPPYTRESIGITAAAKSTLAGALVLELRQPPETVDLAAAGAAGVSLTYAIAARLVSCHPVAAAPATHGLAPPPSALVLIEKESIYHAVLQCVTSTTQRWRRSFSFLCTKGYPCVAAQAWLRRVHAVWPSLELHALVDGDPHGLCIALTAMGLLGAHARHLADMDAAAPLLPFHLIGVCPSRVFNSSKNINSTKMNCCCGSAAPQFTLPASAGGALTCEDRQVLRRLRATLGKALSKEEKQLPPADSLGMTAATARRTLETMLHEVSWMERSSVKCELQLACKPYPSPLHFIDTFISM